MSSLAKWVELRRLLLTAEVRHAEFMGRTEEAKTLNSELRCLIASPAEALLRRIAPGKAAGRVCRSLPGQQSFERELAAVRGRLAEMEAEVRRVAESRRAAKR